MNKVFKSIASVSAAAVVLAATLTPVLVSAYGDNTGTQEGRQTYTIAQIEDGALGENITFNSISDGKIGDERYFVGAKVAGTTVDTWPSEIKVKDGETYTVRLYVHNNSPRAKFGMAKGVKATFSIPSDISNNLTIVGYLDSSNATPSRYWDEVKFVSDDNIYLEFVSGSAKFENTDDNNNPRVWNLPDEVITSGAMLGYDSMNGEIPGCFKYDGQVTIDVKVHSMIAARVFKQVRIKGTKEWSESVNAKVGDEVEYQIEYQNLLAEEVKDVMIRDILPTNVEYVPDSTILYNSSNPKGMHMKENTLTTTGLNIGDYAGKDGDEITNAYIRFTGKVVDKTLACGANQLVNWAAATVDSAAKQGEVYKDDASVMVDKSCDNPTPTPTPTPTPDNPGETPSTIVSTGAGTIVTGAIGAGSVVTALGYYLASRKKLM